MAINANKIISLQRTDSRFTKRGSENVSRMTKNYKFSPKPATRLKNTEFIATGCSTLADAVGMQLI